MKQIKSNANEATRNMSVEALTAELSAAFPNAACLCKSPPEEIAPEYTLAIVESFSLISDEDKRYELPRAMCVAVTQAKSPLREELLCRLMQILDVDFFDPEGSFDNLKELKQISVSEYSTAQSLAIWNWLTFVKVSYELRDCSDRLASALGYWGQRARSPQAREHPPGNQ